MESIYHKHILFSISFHINSSVQSFLTDAGSALLVLLQGNGLSNVSILYTQALQQSAVVLCWLVYWPKPGLLLPQLLVCSCSGPLHPLSEYLLRPTLSTPQHSPASPSGRQSSALHTAVAAHFLLWHWTQPGSLGTACLHVWISQPDTHTPPHARTRPFPNSYWLEIDWPAPCYRIWGWGPKPGQGNLLTRSTWTNKVTVWTHTYTPLPTHTHSADELCVLATWGHFEWDGTLLCWVVLTSATLPTNFVERTH